MKFISLSPTVTLEEEKGDYKSGTRLGQYRLSTNALYWASGEYLPFSAITETTTSTAHITVKGCCGKAVPVPRVTAYFDGQLKNILFDSTKQVNAFLDNLEKIKKGLPERCSLIE